MHKIRVVAAAIQKRGKLFVAKRSRFATSPGLWELPGGKVERDESDKTALQREIQEELGIQILVQEYIGESEVDIGAVRIHMIVYSANSMEEPKQIVHEDSKWLSAAELTMIEWAPADIPLISVLQAWMSKD